MKVTHYEDQYFHYFWKPQGLASSFGKNKSFLDVFEKDSAFESFLDSQKIFFSRDEEYGLLNRLDNDTGGLLYFAKNPLFKKKYQELQQKLKIQKIYIAEVFGDLYKFCNNSGFFTIETAIAHHRFEEDRMVALINNEELSKEKLLQKYKNKIRGKIHYNKTKVIPLRYDEETKTSTTKLIIHKGIRHQIRVHLSSIGSPIFGDKIYNKKNPEGNLKLFSIGIHI